MVDLSQSPAAAPLHPANPGPGARSVCVILSSSLRDFVLSLGAIEAIAASYPRANLVLAVEGGPNRLAEACPFIDSCAPLEQVDFKQAKFDIVYDLATPNVSKAAYRSIGKRTIWCGMQQDAAMALPTTAPRGRLARLAHQLSVAGVPFSGALPLPDFDWVGPHFDHAPRLQPAYFSLAPPFALIALDGTPPPNPAAWGEANYLKLTKAVADYGLTPALVGEHAEGSLAQAILTQERRAVNLVNRAETAQLVTIAAQANFAVGANTSSLALAALLGRPGIVLRAATKDTLDDDSPVGAPYIQIYGEKLSDISVETVCQAVISSDLTNP